MSQNKFSQKLVSLFVVINYNLKIVPITLIGNLKFDSDRGL